MAKDLDVKVTVRNAHLLKAILNKHNSVAEFAREIGRDPSRIGSLVGMKTKPYGKKGWTQLAFDIAAYLGKDMEQLWPEHMRDIKLKKSTASFEASLDEVQQIMAQSNPTKALEHLDVVKVAISGLTPRELKVIKMHQIDGDNFPKIAKDIGVSGSQAHQIYLKALRKMRHRLYVKGFMKKEKENIWHRELEFSITDEGRELFSD
tara:strand:- start:42 stop:656 length:615 start_codon:yes stop_codon:yes gene_type:complete